MIRSIHRTRFFLLGFTLTLLFISGYTMSAHGQTIEEDKAMGDSYYQTTSMKPFSIHSFGAVPFSVPTNPAKPTGTIATGVDISHHNGTIDFASLKNVVDFVILRCGYGSDLTSQDDRQFERNVKECIANQIPFGIYLYSYADTEEKAKLEAQHTLRLLKKSAEWNAQLSLPVFYDLEDSTIRNNTNNTQKATIAKIYCSTLQSYGIPVGIYANTDWWEYELTDPYFKKIPYCWVARYNATLGYSGKCDIWQCSENAVLTEIPGSWDLNYMLHDIFLKTKCNLKEVFGLHLLNTCRISEIPAKTYTGTALTPAVSVSFGNITFTNGASEDYTLSYSNNTKPGLATVTIKGTGRRLIGTAKKTFVILPKKVTISKVSRLSKGGSISWKKAVGASGYQINYRKKGSKTWKSIYTNKLTRKITKLKKKSYYQVRIRAYKTISTKKYYGAFSSVKTWKTK